MIAVGVSSSDAAQVEEESERPREHSGEHPGGGMSWLSWLPSSGAGACASAGKRGKRRGQRQRGQRAPPRQRRSPRSKHRRCPFAVLRGGGSGLTLLQKGSGSQLVEVCFCTRNSVQAILSTPLLDTPFLLRTASSACIISCASSTRSVTPIPSGFVRRSSTPHLSPSLGLPVALAPFRSLCWVIRLIRSLAA